MNVILVITALCILSSCQKSSRSDVKATEIPTDQLQGAPPAPVPEPPAPAPPTPEPVVPPAAVLPTLSFGFDEYVHKGDQEINMELVLSKASDVPVTVEVKLVDGTAVYFQDYSGFLSGGDAQKQTVVIPPNQTRMDLPLIWIQENAACGTTFTAHLSGVQQAVVSGDSTRVVINCN